MATVGGRGEVLDAVGRLRPGVTEAVLHPATDTDELRTLATDWPGRVDDHRLLVPGEELRMILEDAGVTLIGYRLLRDLMRKDS